MSSGNRTIAGSPGRDEASGRRASPAGNLDVGSLLDGKHPDGHVISIIGFACHLAFVSYLVWPSAMDMFDSMWAPETSRLLLFCKSALFVAAFFVLCAVSLKKPPSFSGNAGRRAAGLAVGVIAAVGLGAAAAVTSPLSSIASNVCAATSGCLLGLATACGYAFWQHIISSHGPRLAAIETLAGTAMAGAVYFVFVWLPGPAVLTVSIVLFLAGSCPCLVTASRLQGSGQDETEAPARHDSSRITAKGAAALARCARAEAVPLLTLAVIGFEWGALHALAASSDTGALTNLYAMGRLAAAGLMFILLTRSSYRVSLTAFHRYALPVLITAAVLLPLLGDGYAPILSCATYTVFGMASIALILACGPVAARHDLHVTAVYCGFFGIVYLSYELGGALGAATLPALAALDPLTSRLLVALAAVYPAALLGFLPARGATPDSDEEAGAASGGLEAPPSQVVAEKAMEAAGLTPREMEVCKLIIAGCDSASVSEALGLSKNTVRFHTKAVYQKLGVHSRQELTNLLGARR